MKPRNWDTMEQKDKQDTARRLLKSVRGQLIISQALVCAIELLGEAKHPETSNIEDMDMLLELFPIYRAIQQVANKDKDTGRYI